MRSRNPYLNNDVDFAHQVNLHIGPKLKETYNTPISFVTPFDIIKSTKKKQASEPDNIPDMALHSPPNKVVTALTNIVNATIITIPNQRKILNFHRSTDPFPQPIHR